ncbi:tRNA1(Val) (adenine(37)-N6)-methyltransferase [Desulfurobacterium atlanticum]|uniref:tRNA1(Val) A37 N6-methylase TrmN6 n=1 Tax=Desulfurobacterium atlanticum TaxID=240169 RepID=A0A238YMM3_9BACT|nr:methyltransferase [Desulfurobacterium atlanticum]SNR71863.1 tRNA1(Val) A37 N6-methylase TrmN6 [Desulfurobacterium atlanticum]
MIDANELDKSTFLKEDIVIYQKKKGFRFGTDTFLLADFVKCHSGEKFIDLGTGSGIIPVLLLKRFQSLVGVALDVLPECVELSRLNAEVNGVSEKLKVICLNVKDVKKTFKPETFDVAITNPPFKECFRGFINPDNMKAIARHEIEGTLKDFIDAAAYLLRCKGRFYMVCPVERFADALCFCRQNFLEPKTVRFVQPFPDENANLFLLEARKRGGKGLKVLPPLVIYRNRESRVYTDEMVEKYRNFFNKDGKA